MKSTNHAHFFHFRGEDFDFNDFAKTALAGAESAITHIVAMCSHRAAAN